MNIKSAAMTALWFFASPALALPPAEAVEALAADASDRDALWKLVSNCLSDENHEGAEYCANCSSPLLPLLPTCSNTRGWSAYTICRHSTEVWLQTSEFVAIRGSRMCGCPESFVHGMALPLRQVTGVEDPSKPAGLWQFSWEEASAKISDKNEIVLAANPRSRRTQDQLHIHLMRLAKGARTKLMDLHPTRVRSLSDVWGVAARHAAAARSPRNNYGVAVVRDQENDGFLVATSPRNLERLLGEYSCRP